ncbi:MAG: tRNA lysidine(34) synthetase TilS [Candidatus Aminicenantes bacterium]|nr:tRNA lysidine(34) synthetase TilS [Candidatus Aminicenantes bacterium]
MKYIYPIFFKHIKEFNLIEKGQTVITAFSGGKDSVTLLHLLSQLKTDIPFEIIAAYLNHRIREDYLAEQQFVENFCSSLKIKLISKSENVIRFKEKNKLNLENAASILRYRFIRKVANQFKNSKIATGHTKSDLAETFFINLFRGSGSRGLSTIYSQKGQKIIRPLLIFSHHDIHAFLNRNKLSFYQDYSNRDNTYIRNNIRNNLIPAIQKIEPDVEERIFKTVLIVQEQHDYLINQSREFLKKNLVLKNILPLRKVKACHIALQRYILREYISQLKGNLLNINFEHVDAILKNNKLNSGTLPGLALTREQNFLFPQEFHISEYLYSIQSEGTLTIKEINRTIYIKKTSIFKIPKHNFEIIVPLHSIQFPLLIRNARKDDKYIKINSSVNQQVFEMIRSSGVPARLRNYCPLLLNATGDPIWVAGSPIADAFKVKNKKETRFIKISYFKTQGFTQHNLLT